MEGWKVQGPHADRSAVARQARKLWVGLGFRTWANGGDHGTVGKMWPTEGQRRGRSMWQWGLWNT